jgi:hypothetical protein
MTRNTNRTHDGNDQEHQQSLEEHDQKHQLDLGEHDHEHQ